MTVTDTTAIVPGMDENEYHSHPALSATGMKHLLRSPLHYRHEMDNREDKHQFDVGHAVHAKVLGVGAGVVEIPTDVLSKSGSIGTNAAREFVETSRESGLIPLKAQVIEEVDAIAEAVLRNTKARRLLELPGCTELSLFATDPDTGVEIRGRLDRLTDSHIPIDLKTTTDVRRHKIRRSIEEYGYDVQAAAYRHLIRLALKAEPRPMQLIFVEVDEPHEVRVVQLAHADYIEGGDVRMHAALRIFADCYAADAWPGQDDHDPDVEAITPNPWYANQTIELKDAV